jgi:exosortase A
MALTGSHPPLIRPRSGDAIWIGVVVAIAAVSIWPTWPHLHDLWAHTTDYSHGYLVAGLTVAWFVHRCLNFGGIAPRASITGTCVLAGALVVWLVAFKASVILGQQALAPLILWASIWSCCGTETARRFAAPIGYLYFAVPIWDAVAPALQTMTIAACQTALAWFHVPAVIHDSVVRIPEGSFRIAEECSGKRYFVSALALASIFAAIAPLRGARTVWFVAIAAGLSMLANWIRVFTVIYAGHATNMTSYLVAKEHGTFGWVIYFVVLVFLFWVGMRLQRSQSVTPHITASTAITLETQQSSHRSTLAYAGVALLCLTFAAVLYAHLTFAVPLQATLALPVPRIAGWSGPLPPDTQWAPRFVGASPQTRGQYRFGQTPVEVYIARYAQQTHGAKLISGLNTVLGESWRALETGRLSGQTQAGGIPARAILAQAAGGQRWVVSFVYEVGGIVTGSDAVAQLVYGTRSWTAPTGAEVVAAAVKCSSSCDTAEAAVTALWRTLGHQLL